MKKLCIRIITLIIVLSIVAVFSACGGSKEPAGTDTTSSTVKSTEDNAKEEETEKSILPIVAEPITLKLLTTGTTVVEINNDIPVFKELEKRTNIKIDWQVLPTTGAQDKFNVIMASGDLPDLVSYHNNKADIEKFGLSGDFIPLQDLFKEHAPNIQGMLDNPPYPIPHIKAELSAANGNMYTVPVLSPVKITWIWTMRTDWLAKLNVQPPKTTDELYNVLKNIKEKDPNGNGEPDEVPLVPLSTIKYTIYRLMNAFGAHEGFYVADDNTIKYGPVEAQTKQAFLYLNKLYSEGLIDKEYVTYTKDKWVEMVGNNHAGMMFCPPGYGMSIANSSLEKLDPNYKFEAVLPPMTEGQKPFLEGGSQSALWKMAITSKNKYPVETIKWLDYLFAEEGQLLTNYGIEGQHYNMVDGKPVFTDLILKNPDGQSVVAARTIAGMQLVLPFVASWDCELQVAAPYVVKAYELYKKADIIEDAFPALFFTEEQLAEKNHLQTEIQTYLDEMRDKFIMGIEPLDKFDEFAGNINKMGLDKLLKIYNDQFKSYLAIDNK